LSPLNVELFNYCKRLEDALSFYATAYTRASKKVVIDEPFSDGAMQWVDDDGTMAINAIKSRPDETMNFWEREIENSK
jgi:hypothetical protein